MNRRKTLQALCALSVAGFAPAYAQTQMKRGYKLGAGDALIVVDVQNCFTAGGSLEVPMGDEVVPLINNIAKQFANVIITQDWHTANHVSFASSHPGKKPFEIGRASCRERVLMPV